MKIKTGVMFKMRYTRNSSFPVVEEQSQLRDVDAIVKLRKQPLNWIYRFLKVANY